MNDEEYAALQREEAHIAQLVARLEAERDAAIDAKRRLERERDLMGKRVEQGRAAAVVYVERISEVEAERDTAVATVEKALADVKTIVAERDAAREQVEIERGRGNGYANQVVRVKQVRVWHNEDGKGFVFADDLFAALDGTVSDA